MDSSCSKSNTYSSRDSPSRFYSFVCVFYGSHNELIELLKLTKHWFYIYHDKDETDSHYHIFCTFQYNKSFRSVRRLVISDSTFLCEAVKGSPLDNRDYFCHYPPDKYPDDFHYSFDSVCYDDSKYWHNLFGEDIKPDYSNDAFIEHLLSPSMRVEDMARLYGRDFIKNCEKYIFFRNLCFDERQIDLVDSINGKKPRNIYNKKFG